MGRIWPSDHIELLIETVEKYEQIWNTTNPRYTNNKKIRHYFWKEITKLFNDSHDEVEYLSVEVLNKWNSLRFHFQREHKKMCESGLLNSCWRYYEKLMFLATHTIKKRPPSPGYHKHYSLRVMKREYEEETDFVSVGSISSRNIRGDDGQQQFVSDTTNAESHIKIKTDLVDITEFAKDHGPAILEIGGNSWERQKSFGNYIAAEVMHLELDLQFKAKKIMFDVLMDLQYEQEQRRRGA